MRKRYKCFNFENRYERYFTNESLFNRGYGLWSQQRPIDPILNRNGHFFDRYLLKEWIEYNGKALEKVYDTEDNIKILKEFNRSIDCVLNSASDPLLSDDEFKALLDLCGGKSRLPTEIKNLLWEFSCRESIRKYNFPKPSRDSARFAIFKFLKDRKNK